MAILTTADKLAEAQDAYHKLNVGHQEVEVWDGNFRVRYTAATKGDLKSYIGELQAQLALETSIPQDPCSVRRPLSFYLGS